MLAHNPDSSRPAAYPSSQARSRLRSIVRKLPRRHKTKRLHVDRDSEIKYWKFLLLKLLITGLQNLIINLTVRDIV